MTPCVSHKDIKTLKSRKMKTCGDYLKMSFSDCEHSATTGRFFKRVSVFLYSPQTSSSRWWVQKRILLSSRTGSQIWTRRTHQNCHTSKRNRRNSGPIRRRLMSSTSLWRVKKMMKNPHSFIRDKLNRWKQLMETTVVDQNQTGTLIQRVVYNLRPTLNLILTTVVIVRSPGNLSQV